VYRRLHPTDRALEPQLSYRRVRGVYDGISRRPSPPFTAFTEWTADQLFKANPSVDQVRVRLIRLHITLPHQPFDPNTTDLYTTVIDRSGR